MVRKSFWLLALLMFMPVMAFTIGDDICEGGDENSTNSPDCAIVLPNLSILDSGEYDNVYVNVTGMILENDETYEFFKYLYVRGIYDNARAFSIVDNYGTRIINLPIGCISHFINKSESPFGHLVNAVGLIRTLEFFPIESIFGELKTCNSYVDLGISPYTPSYRIIPSFSYETEEETFGDTYALTKIRHYETDRYYYYYYEIINETHILRNNLLDNSTIIQEVNETRVSEIGNFSSYRTLFYPYPNYFVFYSFTPFPTSFLDKEYYDVVGLGDAFKNQCINPDLCYTGFNILSDYDIIGDGICGSFESHSQLWRLDPQCLEEYHVELPEPSITGFAVGIFDPIGGFFNAIGGLFSGFWAWLASLFGLT